MQSVMQIYKVGFGPSSSHTMGPERAAKRFKSVYTEAKRIHVILYGSLAATGKGHATDTAIIKMLEGTPCTIDWQPTVFLPFHPNGMDFEAFDADDHSLGIWRVYSIGGGFLNEDPTTKLGDVRADWVDPTRDIYELSTMADILDWCKKTGCAIWEYALAHEPTLLEELKSVWETMKIAVEAGLEAEGVLPGGLGLQRKAAIYYQRACGLRTGIQGRGYLYAYALAVAEENAASTSPIVTAPTCGSAGVLPAVLYYLYKHHNFSETRIIRALATAGIVALIAKTNASLSGAEVGCQGEIGVACSMAAAAASQLFGGSPLQIEYAAEMGLEHHLGLTCDPICGLVQIPCIERNAFAAARAMDANLYSALSDGQHRVSFDKVVRTMLQTGHDLPSLYKETSTGGLAIVDN